jgi:hypothetical protein
LSIWQGTKSDQDFLVAFDMGVNVSIPLEEEHDFTSIRGMKQLNTDSRQVG